ncbi:MFS transporter [Pseudonocardia kujensis]|uniref:MFS transporter n=1 Tax=Pseudonocardia kujensis TaxID=1128675 RepID=UPI001E63D782|nr:MFS transporter [Pseudonocardia kujensis]MCE0764586.1 MFS transporter [Pseudonocardia kujensis]
MGALTPPSAGRLPAPMIAAFCALVLVFDGYDVSVFATTIPALLQYEPWGLNAAELGFIASLALIGMLIGSLLCGFATDVLGRKLMLMASSGWFSVCMAVCALAPTATVFGIFRFLAGLGLGGVMPTAIALAVEFAPKARRNVVNMVLTAGFMVGTLVAALLGIVIIEAYGFRPMYVIAALPLLLLPVAWLALPESIQYLVSKGRLDEARAVAARYGVEVAESPRPDAVRRSPLRSLARRPLLGFLIVFGIGGLVVQLLMYGLNTWLPQLMRMAGYPLGSALSFLATMSLGAIAGGLVMSWAADRSHPRLLVLLGFGIGVVALVVLASGPSTAVLYVAVALAGVGGSGTAAILNGYVATWFPTTMQASALGTYFTIARLGGILGPIAGGWIIAAGLPVAWTFYALLVPTAIGVLLVFLMPRSHAYAGDPLADGAEPSTGRTVVDAS